MTVRGVAVRFLVGGVVLAGGAVVATPAQAAGAPVSLIVGLRRDADVVTPLERSVDVVDSESLAGAVTVDVPAGQVAEAADKLRDNPAVAYVERDQIARIAATRPDDPYYANQWGLTRTDVPGAWDVTKGAGSTVVAVVDTGVRVVSDLAGRVLPGRDFVNDDNNADDDQGHGTMTAGVIAARGDNGKGAAGICWTCKILPVKVLDNTGTGSYTDIAQGIRWAADQGADIINLSLGGDADLQLLRDAVTYAGDKGALVIAAAGNDGKSTRHYPAAIPSVLGVGAATSADARYSWSNHGSWVDIAAPGCNPAQARNGKVGQFCGTSSATPFVSGVAALLASTSPAPTAATIGTALTSSAVKISGGWVAASSGRIDAAAAMAALPAAGDHVSPATSFRTPGGNSLVRGTVRVEARATDDVGVAKVQLLADGKVVGTDRVAPYRFSWRPAGQGDVTLRLRAYDRGGNVSTAVRRVTVDNGGPAVRITSGPANGARNVRKTTYVTATAADPNGISRLELLVNGKVKARYAGATHRFQVQPARRGTVLKVQVRAYDRAGNVRSAPARKWYR
jgi:subtilisin family serine protease